MTEKFMKEYFSYRTIMELSIKLCKNWENLPLLWRLRGIADEEIKEKLPTFTELERKIRKDPSSWEHLLRNFKGLFFAKYYALLFEEELEQQLAVLRCGEDVCDFLERKAYNETIKILEKHAIEELKRNEFSIDTLLKQ